MLDYLRSVRNIFLSKVISVLSLTCEPDVLPVKPIGVDLDHCAVSGNSF